MNIARIFINPEGLVAENVIAAVGEMGAREDVDLYILSPEKSEAAKKTKNAWVDKYLPEISEDKRYYDFFANTGTRAKIIGGIRETDIYIYRSAIGIAVEKGEAGKGPKVLPLRIRREDDPDTIIKILAAMLPEDMRESLQTDEDPFGTEDIETPASILVEKPERILAVQQASEEKQAAPGSAPAEDDQNQPSSIFDIPHVDLIPNHTDAHEEEPPEEKTTYENGVQEEIATPGETDPPEITEIDPVAAIFGSAPAQERADEVQPKVVLTVAQESRPKLGKWIKGGDAILTKKKNDRGNHPMTTAAAGINLLTSIFENAVGIIRVIIGVVAILLITVALLAIFDPVAEKWFISELEAIFYEIVNAFIP
jgi:hypothetical protein